MLSRPTDTPFDPLEVFASDPTDNFLPLFAQPLHAADLGLWSDALDGAGSAAAMLGTCTSYFAQPHTSSYLDAGNESDASEMSRSTRSLSPTNSALRLASTLPSLGPQPHPQHPQMAAAKKEPAVMKWASESAPTSSSTKRSTTRASGAERSRSAQEAAHKATRVRLNRKRRADMTEAINEISMLCEIDENSMSDDEDCGERPSQRRKTAARGKISHAQILQRCVTYLHRLKEENEMLKASQQPNQADSTVATLLSEVAELRQQNAQLAQQLAAKSLSGSMMS